MADIKGIELASDIYGLEDETARDNAETNTSAIGTLANLATTAKTNLVAAINELVEKINNLLNGNDWVTLADGISYKVVGKTVFVHINTQTCYFPNFGTPMKDGDDNDVIFPQALIPEKETDTFICNNQTDTIWRLRLTRYGTLISWDMKFQEQTFALPLNTSNWQGDFSYRLD